MILYIYDKNTYQIYGVIENAPAFNDDDFTPTDALCRFAYPVFDEKTGETFFSDLKDKTYFYEDVAFLYGEKGLTSDDIRKEVESF